MEVSSNWLKLRSKQEKKTTNKNAKNLNSSRKHSHIKKGVKIRTPLTKIAEIKKIEDARKANNNSNNNSNKSSSSSSISLHNQKAGKIISMDCEFVGVGEDGAQSELARVSIVNFYGNVIYDTFVQPTSKVTDWRTWVSGVTSSDMESAVSFQEAQGKVSNLLQGRVLVGHAIKNDLEALFLTHPRSQIRDTSKHTPFRTKYAAGKTPSLKKLAAHILKKNIQDGQHSSVEDAKITMELYKSDRKKFEELSLKKCSKKSLH